MARSTLKGEEKIQRCASRSANRIHAVIGYLEAALGEIEEAKAWADSKGSGLDANEEEIAAAHLLATLREDGTISSLRMLRDRRAARAGFSFTDDE